MIAEDRLNILADSAKYDVSCSSSGSKRQNKGGLGNAHTAGICHSWAEDGRCISLLKLLMTNKCIYDCKYCVNRRSNDVPRAELSPDEIAQLTIEFYKRNYIEGLFLSSAIIKTVDHTMELLVKTLWLLRNVYHFHGYIHVKIIPGSDPMLVQQAGLLADRVSVNIELPSENSLQALAPSKTKSDILTPMKQIQLGKQNNRNFVGAGQTSQMIIGASGESDLQILNLTQGLYDKFSLKRMYFSAYVPVASHTLLPAIETKPPLLREHRLYQADWLLRFYDFRAEELLDDMNPNFDPTFDPKCYWAIQHIEFFPVDINTAPYRDILRVPGIGVTSAKRIITARKYGRLRIVDLKKIGVVLKRAKYFIVTADEYKTANCLFNSPAFVAQSIQDTLGYTEGHQLSFLSSAPQPVLEGAS